MREFLLTNQYGSYVNMPLSGLSERMYGGWLAASLSPPQDRVIVLESIGEYIIDGEEGASGEAHRAHIYTPETICPETCILYEENNYFAKAVFPSERFSLTRRVCIDKHGSNTVRIDYEVTNCCDRRLTLKVEPHLTFRKPDSMIDAGHLIFERVSEVADPDDCMSNADGESGYCLRLRPQTGHFTDYSCEIQLCVRASHAGLTCERKDSIIAGYNYPADARTGSAGESACFVPEEFRLEIPAGEAATMTLFCGVLSKNKGTDELKRFVNRDITELERIYAEEWDTMLRTAKSDEAERFFRQRGLDNIAEVYSMLVRGAYKFITLKTGPEGERYHTVMAGYPWFYDWGRDTMIAFTGLLPVTGQFGIARDVLRAFLKYCSHGLLPNVFPASSSDKPQYNTADASLWFFYAADMYARFSKDEAFVRDELVPVLRTVIDLYSRDYESMRNASSEEYCYGIYMDEEGLVHAGEAECDQLTWMDVRIDGKAVTPRHGTPVEIQALMYNAVCVMMKYDVGFAGAYSKIADRIRSSAQLFYNPKARCLYDYIEGEPGKRFFNARQRPNQIFAVSLPNCMFEETVCRDIVDTVSRELVTGLGIRSLSPSDPAYIPAYEGDLLSRDRAYHSGTSWGFLTGHYIIALTKVYGAGDNTLRLIDELLEPYVAHIAEDGCYGGFAEVFDGDNPLEGKGCYNQAWSVGCMLEALRSLI